MKYLYFMTNLKNIPLNNCLSTISPYFFFFFRIMNTKIAATLYLYSKSQILISLICTLVYFAICFIFIVKIPRNNKKKQKKHKVNVIKY